MVNFLNFRPFQFFSAGRWWLVLGGRRRVCTLSSETFLEAFLELCLGVTVSSPVSPSRPADPATSFHSYSPVMFQFPAKVLQFAVVLITLGDALFVLPIALPNPVVDFSLPWAFCELHCLTPGAEFHLAAGQARLSAPHQGRFSLKSSLHPPAITTSSSFSSTVRSQTRG